MEEFAGALREPNCDICGFLDTEEPGIVLISEYHRLILAPDQRYLGRAYLTLGRHAARISDLTSSEVMDMFDVISRYERAVRNTLGATHLTTVTLMNNAYREPDPLPHVHSHLRPRYGKAPVEAAGLTFSDPNPGEHHLRDSQRLVGDEVLAEIALLLRPDMEPEPFC